MPIAIPKWVMIRYSALFRTFKSNEFTREEANRIFEKFKLNNDENPTNTFFSELNKRGWVEICRDEDDSRRKIFKLVSPEKAILNLELKEVEE